MKGILLTKGDTFNASVTDIDEAQLPEGDVTVKVDYSTLNYKDGLAIVKGSVVRKWPLVPGIDCAGTVEASSHAGITPNETLKPCSNIM